MDMENVLRKANLRATVQRMVILEMIKDAGHVDVDHIYKRLKEKVPSISLATVYKNLHSLKNADLIKEVMIEGRKSVYEFKDTDHIHVVCVKCGKIEDMHEGIDSLNLAATKNFDRPVYGLKVTLESICSDCARNKN